MTDAERRGSFSLHDWLVLAHSDKMPGHMIYDLLKTHGSPGGVVSSLRTSQMSSMSRELLNSRVKKCLEWGELDGNHVICFGTELYPRSLFETRDPPVALFASGDAGLLDRQKLLVIGEDVVTPAGAENARIICRALADSGMCLAVGSRNGVGDAVRKGVADADAQLIDLLESVFDANDEARNDRANGRQGLALYGNSFPRRGADLAAEAYGMGVGVTDACLVIEARLKSRVLGIARYALESGKEVFAMPGSINAHNYRGCNRLIRDGAHLVESYEDVLEVLGKKAAYS